jgi:hypothetical protein
MLASCGARGGGVASPAIRVDEVEVERVWMAYGLFVEGMGVESPFA